jgi:hypothetical protein
MRTCLAAAALIALCLLALLARFGDVTEPQPGVFAVRRR